MAIWLPRCPRCGEGNLTLAPANEFTKHICDKTEIYCPHCTWRGMLGDNIKRIFSQSS
jgi:hypothetical protein